MQIKCDRKDPCQNCAKAKRVYLRTRATDAALSKNRKLESSLQDVNSPLRLRTTNSDSRLPSHDGVESPRQLPRPRQDSTEGKSLGDMSHPLEEAHETRRILQDLSRTKRLPARRPVILQSAVKILDEVLKSFPTASVDIPVDTGTAALPASYHVPSFESFHMMLEGWCSFVLLLTYLAHKLIPDAESYTRD
jgi:hypothetical protein